MHLISISKQSNQCHLTKKETLEMINHYSLPCLYLNPRSLLNMLNIPFIFHGEIIATPKTIYKCCILPLTTSSSEICKGITSIQYTANFLALILQ